MTEGRNPTKGDPDPPDITDGETTTQRDRTGKADEADVIAFQQPADMAPPAGGAASNEEGDPDPPDTNPEP